MLYYIFSPDITSFWTGTSYAVWLYYRFDLSHRDIEDLLAERGITVSHQSIRLWCIPERLAAQRECRSQGESVPLGHGLGAEINQVAQVYNGE